MAGPADYLDGTYLRQNPDWHVSDAAWRVDQIVKILRRNQIVPATVYDVGCGAGEVLRLLQLNLGLACELWGADVSPQAIGLCQSRANDRLHFALLDERPQVKRSFDLVIAIDVLAHIEDYRGFLRGLKAMGTYKLIHIPLDLSVQHMLRDKSFISRRKQHVHLHYFTSRTARFALDDLGYELIDWYYTPRMIDNPVHAAGKLLRLPRRLLFSINQELAVSLLGGFSLMALAK
jgi:SAM-dependent methyltransferase